jgi:hypothetical protein
MKHMYVTHCTATDALNTASSEDVNNFFKKIKESAKENGFDLIFWGNPWGVLESLSFVVVSEKSLDKYIAWRGVWGQKVAKEKLPSYISAGNTTIITSL